MENLLELGRIIDVQNPCVSVIELVNENKPCQTYVAVLLSPSVITTLGIYNYAKLLVSNLKKYQMVEAKSLKCWEVGKLVREIRNCRAVILPHCRFLDMVFLSLSYPILLLSKRPIIIVIHDVHGLSAKTKNWIWFMIIFLRSSIIPRLPNIYTIFNSNYTKNSVRTIFNTPMNRSFVMYPIVPFNFRKKTSCKEKEFVLIFGRLSKILSSQCFADMVKGYALAIEQGLGWNLLIAGSGIDSEIQRLQALLSEIVPHKHRGSVILMPNVTNFRREQLLHDAKVLVYPIPKEGLGLPALEAISQGTPVITYRKTSLREIVGDAGILVDWLSISEFSNILLKLYRNEEYLRKLTMKTISQYRKLKLSSLYCLKSLVSLMRTR